MTQSGLGASAPGPGWAVQIGESLISLKSIVGAGAVVAALGVGSAVVVSNLATATPVGNAYEIVSVTDEFPNTGTPLQATLTATCPVNSVAVGGGYSLAGLYSPDNFYFNKNTVTADGSGWTVHGEAFGWPDPASATVYVVCAPVF